MISSTAEIRAEGGEDEMSGDTPQDLDNAGEHKHVGRELRMYQETPIFFNVTRRMEGADPFSLPETGGMGQDRVHLKFLGVLFPQYRRELVLLVTSDSFFLIYGLPVLLLRTI